MVNRIHNKVIELLDDHDGMEDWLASDGIEARETKQLNKMLSKLVPAPEVGS
jgi:hypothetical protein